MIMTSNERRYHFQVINFLSHELPAYDLTTASYYSNQQELTLRIYKLQASAHELAQICRQGGICLPSIGCDNRPFNDSIGFTRDLVMSGVDNLLDTHIEHAIKFLYAPNYTYSNPDLYVMYQLEPDLTEGLRAIDATLLDIERRRSGNFVQIGKVLFAIAVVFFVFFYLLIFHIVISAAKTQMAQMVTVLFWIPNEIATKSAEIQKFLVSGTVEATEETQ
ncbi:hypothetical protein HDV00_012117 [Rhizophlyctis rosea]|nr:hypothetical protein HDV00_012117 [Rhizophlyctis rosea]